MSKTALITGATSGFGKSAVELFVANGWKVIATGRREDRLNALKEALGDAVHCLAFDVQDSTQIDSAIAALPDEFKTIDLLINNAG
ncbi:MAG: SDR family NAD(P)-dependent oxidoreductase, partial [Betaproteobacteria bacterium]